MKNTYMWKKTFPDFNSMVLHYPSGLARNLGALAQKNVTDKGGTNIDGTPIHGYTDFYQVFFEARKNDIKKVLEFGIGSRDLDIPSNMGAQAIPGASLRMWREFFPKAHITGVDIDPKTMLREERITTAVVDQLSRESIAGFLSKEGQLWDLIIEDGLHSRESIINCLEESIDYLEPNGYMIVEDLDNELINEIQSWVASQGKLEGFFVAFREPKGRTRGGYLFVARRLQ